MIERNSVRVFSQRSVSSICRRSSMVAALSGSMSRSLIAGICFMKLLRIKVSLRARLRSPRLKQRTIACHPPLRLNSSQPSLLLHSNPERQKSAFERTSGTGSS
eukprot:Mycagemm_TRINITY_DN10053_c0_g2::TRINITY_DN10053_c0_g2_i1::g.2058::m.2058 type:complete len:104 gc:universal TRINITY_DN10053_c0_g2_i1:231-542(+)